MKRGSLWEKGDEDDEVKKPDVLDDGDYYMSNEKTLVV